MVDANSTVETLRDADGVRREIALDAAGQIEHLFIGLRDLATADESSEEDMRTMILALSLRGTDLINAAQRALADPNEEVAELRQIVRFGLDRERSHHG